MALAHTRRFLLASFLGALLVMGRPVTAVQSAANQALLDLMAQARAENDLGRYDAAIRALTAIVEAPDAPPALRAEALVRLGVARRAAGDLEGSMCVFLDASTARGLGRETKALLVQALGGALPAAERWAEIWPRVTFAADRSRMAGSSLAIVWPGLAEPKSYRGHPITLDFEDGDLHDVFRLFADITGFNVVVSPGVRGRVTFRADGEPWDRCLGQILAANGLAFRWTDNVLWISSPERLPAARRFSGRRIDLDYNDRDLVDVLGELAAKGGVTAEIDPAVGGSVTLKLNQVRWDQAFDVVVAVNGLDWKHSGATVSVFPRKTAARP